MKQINASLKKTLTHLSTKDGLATNAVYGFLNIMFSLIDKEKPDLIGVAFDISKPTFRHVQNADYKSHRKSSPTPVSIVKGSLLCNSCHGMFHINCL